MKSRKNKEEQDKGNGKESITKNGKKFKMNKKCIEKL